MLHRLPGRINRLLYGWASQGSLDSFCRRFNRLNTLRWGYPIRIEPVGEPGTHGRLIKVTDDTGRALHIGRRSRVPLYIHGISARRRQLLQEYVLGELVFTEDDLVVDVGANVGELTTAIQEQAPVHAICIEPEELECGALRRNVMPGLAHVHNALLYRDEREVAFFSANDRGDSSLFEPKHHTGKCIRRTTTLDAVVTADPLFQARGRVRLLKLEAEGAEPEILEGGSTVLPCCDYITADLGPERGASQETTLIPVIEGLAKYGFKPIRFGLPRCVMLFDSSSESDATQRGVRFRKDLMRAAKTRGVDRPPRREACRPLQRRDIPRARRAAGDLGYLVVDKAIHGLCSLGRPVESRGFRPVGSRRILRRQACSTVCYTLQIIFVGLRRRSWNRTFAGERHVGAEDARMETKDGLTYLSAPATVSMGDAWFDVAHVNHFWITRRFAVFDRLLRRCGRPDSSSSIGEIGCGSGIVQEQMRTAYGAHVDGFDLNEYALTHPVNPRNARFLYDIHERQEPLREKYDFLILFDVIEHIDDESHFIDSVLFHLRSGGSLAVNVPALQWLYSAYDRAAGHVRRYSVRSLQAAFESRGMKTIADTYWGLPYMPLLLARKALLGNTQVDDATIRKGFSPRGGIGNAVLGGLGRCEWLPQRLLGTSAMAIFRKS